MKQITTIHIACVYVYEILYFVREIECVKLLTEST